MSYKDDDPYGVWKKNSHRWDGVKFLVKGLIILFVCGVLLTWCGHHREDLINDCKDRGGQVITGSAEYQIHCIEPNNK